MVLSGNKFSIWLSAIRLRTLPLALASIAMGSFLAASQNQFDWLVFTLASLTTIFLQILSNLANDYGDSIHGADSHNRLGPKRAVQSGLISQKKMRTGIYLTALMALASGISLLFYEFSRMNAEFAIFLLLGIGAIAAAFGYTMGKKPYGYAGFGDLFVFIFFGFIGVLGTYYLHVHDLDIAQILPAMASGFLATAVLNINNIRDIKSDTLAGKRSIPVRLGRKKAVVYHIVLISGAFISAIIFVIIEYNHLIQFLFLLSLPLFLMNIKEVQMRTKEDALDPSLKKLALSTLLFTIMFGTGQILQL